IEISDLYIVNCRSLLPPFDLCSLKASGKGRMATVKKREPFAQTALTRNEVGADVGLHTLRHSFISACASKGVDQRRVQEWAGHMNEATSKRYRHLYPSTQQEAIK